MSAPPAPSDPPPSPGAASDDASTTATDPTRNPTHLVAFVVIAFAMSWLAWLPSLLTSTGLADLSTDLGIVGILAPFGPLFAALLLTLRHGGPQAVGELLRRGWDWRFDKRWWVPLLLLMPATAAATVGVMAITGQTVEWEYALSPAAAVPMFVFILLLNAAPEEYGWRGYALGGLLRRHGALVASLVLGAIWGVWHLPLHFIEGTVQEAIPIYQFVLQQMVLAVFYTWLYVNTGGSVSVAILFHAIANVVGAVVPTWTTELGRWTGFAVQLAFAAAIVAWWGPRHLRRTRAPAVGSAGG